MKYSIYNSFIAIGEKHTLLFNSFTGKFVVVRNKLVNPRDSPVDDIYRNHKILYRQFVDAGIVIDDHVDEVALLKRRIYDADNNADEYILHINPTLDCNFRCWYCYENHVPHSMMDAVTLKSVLSHIDTVLHNPLITTFELGFFGGEPLMHFNSVARKIISHAKAICDSSGTRLHIHFTSNGSLLNDSIADFLADYPCGFQITLDGGKVFHDKTRFHKNSSGSYDVIVRNILCLLRKKIEVIVRINYTADNIDSVGSVYDTFKHMDNETKRFVKFDFQRVWQDRVGGLDETEEKIRVIRRKFSDDKFTVLANYIPHDARNSCYGDKLNHILINYNGDVYGCTARDFTPENRIGVIDQSGTIHYDRVIMARRNAAKFSKAVCLDCRIAPICGGGCKQRALEAIDFEGCTFGYTDDDKDGIITDIFEHSFNLKQ